MLGYAVHKASTLTIIFHTSGNVTLTLDAIQIGITTVQLIRKFDIVGECVDMVFALGGWFVLASTTSITGEFWCIKVCVLTITTVTQT